MIDPKDTHPHGGTIAKSRDLRIFDGALDGYTITLPNIMIQGDITLTYVTRQGGGNWWKATQPYGKDLAPQQGEWVGTGDTHTEAILHLIAVRLGRPDPGPVLRAARAWTEGPRTATDRVHRNDALSAAVETYKAADAF